MDFDRWAQSAASRLIVRSALNPLLWLCGVVGIPCFVLAGMFREDRFLMGAFVLAGFVPLVVTSFIALRFAMRSPEKLQSEDYQLRQQSLQILQTATGGEIIDAQAVIAIANPALPALPAATGEGAPTGAPPTEPLQGQEQQR